MQKKINGSTVSEQALLNQQGVQRNYYSGSSSLASKCRELSDIEFDFLL